VRISRELCRQVEGLRFGPPVAHVYNPLDYAREPHERYLALAQAGIEALLVGMNPGPFGMVQTGVPFGEVTHVRDWLGGGGRVDPPPRQHPRRAVQGFACPRSEVSGARLWGWARNVFKTPEKFFDRFFIANYCPLAFLEESGRNRTPDKLRTTENGPLLEICDRALRRTVDHLRPRLVVGIGAFAESRAQVALDGVDVTVSRILHPSPASPAANRGWAERATSELRGLGVELP
jgi:single-strand selective monofunctional uracil DNA glycosylase